MNKNINTAYLTIFLFLFCLVCPVLGHNVHHFAVTSPRIFLNNIPCNLHIQALTSNYQIDTTFSSTVQVEGLYHQIKGERHFLNRIGPFIKGKAVVKNASLKNQKTKGFLIKTEHQNYPVKLKIIPGYLSLLPPILAIVLAILLRQVLISLVAGIWLGATFLWDYNPLLGLLRTLDHYIVHALADPDHASILLFSMMLGGMVGIISRSGGTQGIVNKISKFAALPRGGQLTTWFMGIFIFFDDYANTLIVGNTMRPITDRLRISREKLSYIVDSTAAPVSSIAVISTWIGFELGLIQSVFQQLQIDRNIYLTFIETVPYRFYSLLAIFFVFIVSISGRDFGPMLRAEQRARKTGVVLRPDSIPLSDTTQSQITPPQGTPLHWYNAVIPIAVVIIVTMLGLWYSGKKTLTGQGIENPPIRTIIGSADSLSVLLWSSFAGVLSAVFLTISQKILVLRQAIDAWVTGIKSMMFAFIILVLAWTISNICKDLHTADYVVAATRGILSPHILPFLTFIIASFISFATGTSWGTMSILMPIVVPMAYHFSQEMVSSPEKSTTVLIGTIAAVLSGSVFGDHCSPISDTTIMSSMASGSDHVDHVRTQIPYALLVAATAILIGYLPTGYGMKPTFSIFLGTVLLTGFLFLFGKKSVHTP